MADFFRNKLVTGHAFHSATKVAALGILHAHPLLEPHVAYAEGLPYLREYIASLLWVDSTAFSVAAMRSLPAEARTSLCAIFGLTRTPANAEAQSQRIWHFVVAKRAQVASRASTQAGGTPVPAGLIRQRALAQAQAALPTTAAASESLPAAAATPSATAAAAGPGRTVLPGVASSIPTSSGAGGAAAAAGPAATGSAVPGAYGPIVPQQRGPIAGAGGAAQAQGGPSAYGPIVPQQGGPIAGAGGAAQAQGGLQAQQPAGAGGAAQAQGVPQGLQPAVASPLDSMVTSAQALIIAGLPLAAALALVQALQVPTQVGDSDDTVRRKLTIAVWAAETLRSPLDFRGLPTSVRTPALGYLGVDATWAEPLQDAFLNPDFSYDTVSAGPMVSRPGAKPRAAIWCPDGLSRAHAAD
jgi:hypothetical protein